MSAKGRRFLIAGAVALVLAFGYFVWPTPYQYIPVTPGARYATSGEGLSIIAARVNRLTGRTFILLPVVGWVAASK